MKLTIDNITITCKVPNLFVSPLVLRPVRDIDNQGRWQTTMSLQFQVVNQADDELDDIECHLKTYDEQHRQSVEEEWPDECYIDAFKPRHKKSLFFLLEEFDENAACAELIIAEADSFAD